MKHIKIRDRLLGSTVIGGAFAAMFAVVPAMAQDKPAASEDVQEVVVTGSRIRSQNQNSLSPVTVIGAEDVKASGVTRVEDLVNNLPQAFAAQGANVSNGASGTATVNLRGLGASRTLVLVNGRRLHPGTPQLPTADLNTIPGGLIERVDVVTGGASAVYGSDALAGVVNFIMKKNFEGVRLETSYSFYNHKNDNDAAQEANRRAGFKLPKRTVSDGIAKEFSLIMGANSPDGKGNATVYATYRNVDAVLQSERDYSACTLRARSGGGYNCGGSGTTAPASLFANGGAGDWLLVNGTGFRPYNGATDSYNYGPTNYYQRPDERYSLGAFANYEINRHFDVYTEMMFMDNRTVGQIAPSGTFFNPYNFSCSNPLLSASQVDALCTKYGLGANDRTTVLVGRRNVEGGGRQADLRHTSYRIVLGSKGEIDDNWSYDLYAQYGTTVYAQNYLNEFSFERVGRSLDVVRDPATGNAVCASTLNRVDPSCVPYNIWDTTKPISAAALAYVSASGFMQGDTKESVVSGVVSGSLEPYGVKMPYANEGVNVAFGAEYRRSSLDLRTDRAFSSGDLAGQGGPTKGVSGAFDVKEIFGEVRVPIANDQPMIESLGLDLGFRTSDYSSSGTVNSYKAALDYAPTSDIRFRASFQRAVRAPNVVELFTPQGLSLFNGNDPCAYVPKADGTKGPPTASLAACQRTGVTAAQYGNIAPSPAGQYNQFTGGNPLLKPEESDTKSLGFVFTPTFLSGFSLIVDYFDIQVNNRIATIGAQTSLDECIKGNTAFCGLITRDPLSGNLWAGQTGLVRNLNANTGYLKTKGMDIEANYRFDLPQDLGRMTLNFVGTRLTELSRSPGTGIVETKCVGKYGLVCSDITGGVSPKWRHRIRASWNTPVEGLMVGSTWRHIGKGTLEPITVTTPDQAKRVKAINYIDVNASWKVLDSTTLRLGINNLFDVEPPLLTENSTAGLNGNTFAQTYDTLGRYVFMSATVDF